VIKHRLDRSRMLPLGPGGVLSFRKDAFASVHGRVGLLKVPFSDADVPAKWMNFCVLGG